MTGTAYRPDLPITEYRKRPRSEARRIIAYFAAVVLSVSIGAAIITLAVDSVRQHVRLIEDNHGLLEQNQLLRDTIRRQQIDLERYEDIRTTEHEIVDSWQRRKGSGG